MNSGGTKLSKGDLALAKLCAEWPPAREKLRQCLADWHKAVLSFSLDWLLRNVNAVATGRAQFSALDQVTSEEFQSSLEATGKYVGTFLAAVAGRLGLDHDRVFMGRYAAPVVSRLLHLQGGQFRDATQRDQVLFWYVQTALWGRFTGSTETILTQDYEALERGGVEGLIRTVERWRGGNLVIAPHDFEGFGRGSRFYPLLYLLTRVRGARDLGSGLELKAQMLGHLTSLQVHHIFPKALLYAAGYSRGEVNAVGNFCFLTQFTNLQIGKRQPVDYLAEVQDRYPGALESQWIPTDASLWAIERYRDFLAERRRLLANAANVFLHELRGGLGAADAEPLERVELRDDDEPDERAQTLQELVSQLTQQGYVAPELDVEVLDPASGELIGVAEALWPDGLQRGLGRPVVLELDPNPSGLARWEDLGYQVFTNAAALVHEARRRNEVAAGDRSEELVGVQP